MTRPLGNRRPEADVIPLVSFPFRRSVLRLARKQRDLPRTGEFSLPD